MAVLPSGTVTFLFTDIEGSTRRWEQNPDAMCSALTRHDNLLRAFIESNNGVVFKTVGDAFFAAFTTAADAVEAAISAQYAIANEQWGEGGEMRVRMALHTGMAQERDGDYFGTPLNRVARLLSAGHGGQILLSEATQALVRDDLTDGVTLIKLGEHRLKDLVRPEHIFQLLAPGIPEEFAPLKTLNDRLHNLPLCSTPLLGRDQEVTAICENLRRQRTRLATLTGTGGTGKTRLGLQVAAELVSEYEDGVFFVELAPLRGHALVVSSIAQVLGVQESAQTSALDALKEHLRAKQVLLVLDNFEHVIEAATVVSELLASCIRLQVVVTSRVALRISGEHEFPVPSLQLPDPKPVSPPTIETLRQYAAVELFIQRAQAAKPDFVINNDNAPAVAEICARLDGLPLAIELAAARTKLLPPKMMLKRLLESRIKFLTGGTRDVARRQQTLRDTITWSHDLLDDGDKVLLRRLSVFAGGCTLEAAEGVCNNANDLESDVLDGIASLVDNSLLRQQENEHGEPRFWMLETIQEFAHDKLQASGEASNLSEAHAHYYLALAEQSKTRQEPETTSPSDSPAWFESLDVEYDNMRVSWQWLVNFQPDNAARLTLALKSFWMLHGDWMEAQQSFEQLIGREKVSVGMKAKLLCALGDFAYQQGKFAKAITLLEEGARLSQDAGDKETLAAALATMGSALIDSHTSLEQAQAPLEESLALYREINDKKQEASVLRHLAEVAFRRNVMDRAEDLGRQSLEILYEIDDRPGAADAHAFLADIKRRNGDFSAAQEHLEEYLQFCETSPGKISAQLVRLIPQIGPARWQKLLESRLARAREFDDKSSIANSLLNLGWSLKNEGHRDRARACLEESLSILYELQEVLFARNAMEVLSELAYECGNYDEAKEWLEQSVRFQRDAGDNYGRLNAIDELALFHLRQLQLAEAYTLFKQSLTEWGNLNNEPAVALCLANLSKVAYYDKDLQACRLWLERSRQIWEHLDKGQYRFIEAEIACFQGHLERAAGDYAKAQSLYTSSLRIDVDRWPPCLKAMYGIIHNLESLGSLASVQGQHLRATRLWGAAQQLRGEHHFARWPIDRIECDPAIATAQGEVDERTFAAAWEEGYQMTMKEAIAYALSGL